MKVIDTKIPDVKIIEPSVFNDERGFFMETWKQKDFNEKVTGKETLFVQDNHSKSTRGVLRGLHLQTKNPQGKLARVISGEVFDIAVDVRKESPTFGRWVGVYLSAKNKRQIWIPEGFAHGFYVTSNTAELIYKCTEYYNPKTELVIAWDDSSIGIEWPIIDGPYLSNKDQCGIALSKF